MAVMPAGAHSFPNPDVDDRALEAARRYLTAAGFTENNVCEKLGVDVIPNARQRLRAAAIYLEMTAGGTSLDGLIRLFLLQRPIDESSVDADVLENVGLVRVESGSIYPNAELLPWSDLLLASDLSNVGDDQVMGVAASTRALGQFMVGRKMESVLDLGTGCGALALFASRFAEKVIALDVNPRAARVAGFNARLNGVKNVEFAIGDLFRPVQGRTFDLIVCNPPFVVGPAASPVHTSSGEGGDRFCERVVRRVSDYLTENGFAQVLCNWVELEGQSGRERMTGWIEGTGCDAWVLHSHTETADEYARARSSENSDSPADAEKLYEQWAQYLCRERIVGVNFGLVNLRRSDRAKNWLRHDEIPGVHGHCGRSIELGFLLHDYLLEHGDREILDAPIRHADDIEIIEPPTGGPDGRGPRKRLRLESGITFGVTADAGVLDLVDACDGRSTLRSYVRRLSAKRRVPVSVLLPGVLSVVQPLIEYGFLLPVEVASKLDL